MPYLWKSLRDNAAIIVIGMGVLGSYVSVMARLAVVESEVTGLKTMLVKAIDSKILSSR
jgi:hypothetical protein